ncbi:MAG: hypothetical protein ABI539_05795 [Acidobacteriota bacterium]
MKISPKEIAALLAIAVLLSAASCRPADQGDSTASGTEPSTPVAAVDKAPTATPTPPFPNLQAELLDARFKTSTSPLANFDFKNYEYPLPRGWQNPDGSDLTLINGRVQPVSVDTDLGMDPDEIADRRSRRRIGMSYVTTRFVDLTADGQDEAVVILKVETTGAAIPQLVYVYEWRDNQPELIWNFRTGDRADGGLKDIRIENGHVIVELYGQDRFVLGETETGKITGDEEQLCCPIYFTRSFYKQAGPAFVLDGKRLTFSLEEPQTAPLENLGDIVNAKERSKRTQVATDR